MHLGKLNTGYLSPLEINQKADTFREQYWDTSLPIDIEYILDVKLKINIIPAKNLKSLCDTDALISSNWQEIFVDDNYYRDEKKINRLRFSFAHEIGHLILHKQLYEMLEITRVEDYYKFIKDISDEQYGYLETQANKFASFLLLPRKSLINDKNILFDSLKNKPELLNVSNSIINSYLAKPIAKKYGVSEEASELALNSI